MPLLFLLDENDLIITIFLFILITSGAICLQAKLIKSGQQSTQKIVVVYVTHLSVVHPFKKIIQFFSTGIVNDDIL